MNPPINQRAVRLVFQRLKLPAYSVPQPHIEDICASSLRDRLFFLNFAPEYCKLWIDSNRKLFESVSGVSKDERRWTDIEQLKKIPETFFDDFQPSEPFNEALKWLSDSIGEKFSMDAYKDVRNKYTQHIETVSGALQDYYGTKECRFSYRSVSSWFYFAPYKETHSTPSERYFSDLSTGEQLTIKTLFTLFQKMKGDNGKPSILILEDEPDTGLHPEWSRQFVQRYMDAIAKVRKYLSIPSNRYYNFVLTSHSPIVVSDFFKDEIVFLETTDPGLSVQVKNAPACFAGNIGEMLTNNFFMKKTIGDYAEQQLGAVIKLLQSISNGKKKNSKITMEQAEDIVENIGDKLLKKLLSDQVKQVKASMLSG